VETAPEAAAAEKESEITQQEEEVKQESLAEFLERIEKEDQAKIDAALKAFESGNAIDEHISSVNFSLLVTTKSFVLIDNLVACTLLHARSCWA
jgi:hypothetical protein